MTFVTVTTYGCAEYLCHIGLLPGELECRPPQPRALKISDIQRAVAQHFNIPLFEMKSERRAREVCRPRQMAMYLCRELTLRSTPVIGRNFGNRNHTTVLHACQQIAKLKQTSPGIAANIREITAELRA